MNVALRFATVLSRATSRGPLGISGIQYWCDASVGLYDTAVGGSAVVADGEVLRWEDRSSRDNHATQSASNVRPLWRSGGGPSGSDAVEFDGSDDFMDVPSISLNGAFTLVWYGVRDANNIYDFVLGNSTGNHKLGFNNTDALGLRVLNGGTFDTPATGVTTTSWHWYAVRRDASDKIDIAVNAGAWNRAFSDVAQSGTTSFDWLAKSTAYNGKFRHVLFYTSALSQANFQTIIDTA